MHFCFLQIYQKRASIPNTGICESSCVSWEFNSGPLEKQLVFVYKNNFREVPWLVKFKVGDLTGHLCSYRDTPDILY